jgi:hypothetical protein
MVRIIKYATNFSFQLVYSIYIVYGHDSEVKLWIFEARHDNNVAKKSNKELHQRNIYYRFGLSYRVSYLSGFRIIFSKQWQIHLPNKSRTLI